MGCSLHPAGRLYAMQTGMKLDSKTPECRKFLVRLMDQLESVSGRGSFQLHQRLLDFCPWRTGWMCVVHTFCASTLFHGGGCLSTGAKLMSFNGAVMMGELSGGSHNELDIAVQFPLGKQAGTLNELTSSSQVDTVTSHTHTHTPSCSFYSGFRDLHYCHTLVSAPLKCVFLSIIHTCTRVCSSCYRCCHFVSLCHYRLFRSLACLV